MIGTMTRTAAMLAVVAAVLLVLVAPSAAYPRHVTVNCAVANASKINCGYVGINEQECEAKGCCWDPEGQGSSIPWCYDSNAGPPPPPVPVPPGAPFNATEMALMQSYFMKNINIDGDGGVVASPDRNTGQGGSYYYAWARDAALSMRTVMKIMSFNDYQPLMHNYVQWVLKVHNLADPHDIDVRIEPKFNLPEPSVYAGGWCRPQTDGPGLRGMTLALYALELLEQGQQDYVAQYLWTGNPSDQYKGGAVYDDFAWVVDNWQSNGCDLWEEIESDDFFWNRYNMRRAMYVGAELASKLGDSSMASTYLNTAKDIEGTLPAHWNGEFIYESTNREEDAAVILALNDGYNNDDIWAPTNAQVAATISVFTTMFDSAFPINEIDSSSGVPGTLWGRYQGDTYDGGNPWILTTAGLAEIMYRGAVDALTRNQLPDEEAMHHFAKILSLDDDTVLAGPTHFAHLMASQADGVLDRIHYHVAGAGFHLSEQLDKQTGVETSATDLTWSYANVFKAMYWRSQLMDMLYR